MAHPIDVFEPGRESDDAEILNGCATGALGMPRAQATPFGGPLTLGIPSLGERVAQATMTGVNAGGPILGTNGDHVIIGRSGAGTINGPDGNDTILGGPDDDFIDGGASIDTLFGADGNDFLIGGESNDALYDFEGNNRLEDDAGDDVIQLAPGAMFRIAAAGRYALRRRGGRDVFLGGASNDRICAGAMRMRAPRCRFIWCMAMSSRRVISSSDKGDPQFRVFAWER